MDSGPGRGAAAGVHDFIVLLTDRDLVGLMDRMCPIDHTVAGPKNADHRHGSGALSHSAFSDAAGAIGCFSMTVTRASSTARKIAARPACAFAFS